MKKVKKIIISGGGTGGHIFPAISIANAIKEIDPETEILFVGAEGRMEMQRVPDAGYKIIGLPIAGFDRKHLLKNIIVLVKIIRSQWKAKSIIKHFSPQVVVGVGGYASGPTLKVAQMLGIPTLIQEQNSYAGVTNKLLAKNADKICVAYEGMEKFFPEEKIVITGNPVRQNLLQETMNKEESIKTFNLDPCKKTILVVGGSLGALTFNRTLISGLSIIEKNSDIQFIWQTGKYYFKKVTDLLSQKKALPNLHVIDFIKDMNVAYKAADLVISRAGASSISEFCLLHKPVILVPSPNVAEDHQTKNAMALVNKQAALYVKDIEAVDKLLNVAIKTVNEHNILDNLGKHIAQLALPNSAKIIANEVISLIKK
ncbi:MAG: undecaprenyldiphospho-muramoylpentapeptide beta-N-acetylglucosaminyltransferase [Bacteroidaceae bacterium]